jgi:glutathione S-transferase
MNHEVKFYGFSGSHPCEAVYAAARYKRIAFRTVEVPPALHRIIMRVKFGGTRVPAAVIDGHKVQGTSSIFLALDNVETERQLYPGDPEDRARVIAADRWGAGAFQDVGRRLIWSHLSRSPETVRAWVESSSPPGRERDFKVFMAPYMAQVAKFGNRATDEQVQKDLKHLPVLLDRVDELIAEGVIGGDEPNAADFQLLSSIGMWSHMQALRPAIVSRPCGIAAMELFPRYTGAVPAGLLPDEWFEELNSSVPSAA